MKILLIQPPYVDLKKNIKRCQPPLGLAYLAAAIKDEHEVSVLDAVAVGFDKETVIDRDYTRYGLDFGEINKIIKRKRPNVVGISCLFSTQAPNVYELCKAIKEYHEEAIIVLGGAHPSSVPEEALKSGAVDYVIIGEGEVTLRQLLEFLDKGKDISGIDGIGYVKDGKTMINPKRTYVKDLDSIAFPEWGFLPLERYFLIRKPHGIYPKEKKFLPMLTSRGCPSNCIFCSIHNLWGRNYRKRSVQNVLEEISQLIDKFGVKEIYFEDDNFTLDKQRAIDIFNSMIEKNFKIKWSSPNGVFIGALDEDIINLMKKSGCRALSFGIESGDEYILREVIGKRLNLQRAAQLIQKAKALKIETSAFFVLGLPGETRKSLDSTFSYAAKLPADNIVFFFATPLPGTRLNNILCNKMGITFTENDYKNLRSENAILIPEGMTKKEFVHRVKTKKMLLHIRKALKSPLWALSKITEKMLCSG